MSSALVCAVYVSYSTRLNRDDDENKSRFKTTMCAVKVEPPPLPFPRAQPAPPEQPAPAVTAVEPAGQQKEAGGRRSFLKKPAQPAPVVTAAEPAGQQKEAGGRRSFLKSLKKD